MMAVSDFSKRVRRTGDIPMDVKMLAVWLVKYTKDDARDLVENARKIYGVSSNNLVKGRKYD